MLSENILYNYMNFYYSARIIIPSVACKAAIFELSEVLFKSSIKGG